MQIFQTFSFSAFTSKHRVKVCIAIPDWKIMILHILFRNTALSKISISHSKSKTLASPIYWVMQSVTFEISQM